MQRFPVSSQLLALLLLCAVSLLAPRAGAQAGSPAPQLGLEATPLLGPDTPTGAGWFGCAVRVHNPGDVAVEGFIELESELNWGGDPSRAVTRAPFSAAGRSVITVQLPTHGFNHMPPALRVRARDGSGNAIAETGIPTPRTAAPLLFDVNVPSRIAPALRGTSLPVTVRRPTHGSYGLPQLAVGSPRINAATGEPVLPLRAAGYASATVVLARSEQLARLSAARRAALADWILAGGSLALVITRPEDLRDELLRALVGGEVRRTEPPAALLRPTEFTIALDPSAPSPSAPPSGPGSGAVPPGSPPPPGSLGLARVAPSAEVARSLVGYAGANLRESAWGASCSYGLGEVHLLAFDATREPEVSDEWVQLELLALVGHGWDRQAHIAMPHAQTALDDSGVERVRRLLDPNQGARWAIAAAALLLLLYAVFAGPLNFYLAARRGRPLRALIHLPIWAGAALLLVVLLGVLAKGIEGRAHRMTLVEAAAGMPRAAAVRYRGFFASSADRLTVRATERGSVLDVASRSDETQRTLVVDRDGARLEQFHAKPWQTVMVREDGFISLSGGVSVVRGPDGSLQLHNRTARDLLAVLVRNPDETGLRYFPRIRDGERVRATDGEPLGGALTGPGRSSRLGAASFGPRANRDAPDIESAWEAVSELAGSHVDWWPPDTPMVLAQVAGGEGRTRDSGLEVEQDRVLLRVVGYGGVR